MVVMKELMRMAMILVVIAAVCPGGSAAGEPAPKPPVLAYATVNPNDASLRLSFVALTLVPVVRPDAEHRVLVAEERQMSFLADEYQFEDVRRNPYEHEVPQDSLVVVLLGPKASVPKAIGIGLRDTPIVRCLGTPPATGVRRLGSKLEPADLPPTLPGPPPDRPAKKPVVTEIQPW